MYMCVQLYKCVGLRVRIHAWICMYIYVGMYICTYLRLSSQNSATKYRSKAHEIPIRFRKR